MHVQAVDWLAIGPVLVVTATLLLVLLAQVVRPGSRRLLDVLALLGLTGAVVPLVLTVGDPPRNTFCTTLGACSFQLDRLTIGLQAAALLAAVVCLLLALDEGNRDQRVEHHALFLAAVVGTLVLAGARDLLTILIALETASLPVVALVALRRTPTTAEAGIKLLLVSVVSFGLALLGTALLYSGTGAVHLESLAAGARDASPTVLLGLVFLVCGIGYKVAALPFGLWAPDVYAGSPVPVVAFLSTVSKVGGVAALAMILVIGLPEPARPWLAVIVAVTMTLGNAVALTQQVAVRLLAWSAIAHGGWLLLPLAFATDPTTRIGDRGQLIGATTAYLLAYLAGTLTVITVVVLLSRHHRAGPGHLLQDYAGLLRREPVAAVLLLLGLLSLAGLPPGVAGLVGKIAAITPVVAHGVWWLAIVAALNIALGLVYYLRWARAVFAAPDADTPTWRVTFGEGAALSVAAAALIGFSLLPGILL